MASLPKLHVNMNLLYQEDEPISMPPTSRKRRRQYAVLEDNDSDDDYDPPQDTSLQDDDDKFILPDQEDSSESEDEEPAMQAPLSYSDQEEEDYLFQAAFAPRSSQVNHVHGHSDFMNEPSLAQHEIVDLCGSDDDHGGVSYSEGVRIPRTSPRFNADSRDRFSPNKLPRRGTPCNDDDIVECWSDEENQKPRARRVTDIHGPAFSSSQRHWNAPRHDAYDDPAFRSRNKPRHESSTLASYPSKLLDDEDEQAFVPAPSRARNNVLERFKFDKTDRRRRLRDATKTNTAAAVVLRNAPFEQVSSTLWYRQEQAMAPPAMTRNDLTGGSGVGAGSYTLGQSFQNLPVDTASSAASSRGRKKKTTKRSTTKSGTKSKKKSWGGGRKNFYRKKGGQSKSTKNGGNLNFSSARSARASNEEYSRQDPLLKHVGGANIIF